MSSVMEIADAVAAELNTAAAGMFVPAFTAVRRVLPQFEPADLADLKVTVVPHGVEMSGATRSSQQMEVSVDIGVMKKLGTDLDAEVAVLCDLVEQIVDYLAGRRLSALPQSAWVRTANEPIYSPQHLAAQRTFTSVLTVSYMIMR